MMIESRNCLRSSRFASTAVAAAFLTLGLAAPIQDTAEAGSLVIPAWAFDCGNVQIHADPGKYADAGPVVVSSPAKPWGWTVEYDVDFPVDGDYTLQICYAAAEARPIEVFLFKEVRDEL